MKVAVCVKHAVDETELKIDPGGKPQLDGAACKMSTFDKNAVEEALRLKAAHSGEVVIFTFGTPDARKTMKEALAMGADRGVHIVGEVGLLDPMRTSELLAAAILKAGPFDLVVCSEGSSDVYSGQVPPMVAERLGMPYVGYAKKVEVTGQSAKVERSLEESVETVEAPLPLVVSVVSEINEPRYPTLIQIMQASKKPVTEVKPEELVQARSSPTTAVLSMLVQSTARKHVMIEGTPDEASAKLVEVLEKEGVIQK
ncbi:MAG: electron transfer flavoprotein subunit beta/FixA family protein [Candidatus Gagatemarchaeaceae archaeon]